MTSLSRQLDDYLSVALVVPARSLLGLDLADLVEQRLRDRTPIWTAVLTADEHEEEAAELVQDLMGVLWPHGAPEQVGRADWWATPLGRACARSLGRGDAEAVTQHVAAAMLGVTRGTVAQLVARGTLDRHPDGGVLRASVLQRIDRLAG